MRVLVVDVGGTNVKIAGSWDRTPVKVPSGRGMGAAEMVSKVSEVVRDWQYDVVSIGYPGVVKANRPVAEPRNLGGGWTQINFDEAFGKPVRVVNDAAMQALGSYEGGRMLFLGLGTGLGTAVVSDGVLEPLEMAHLPYRKEQTYEQYLGEDGMERSGKKRWAEHVAIVCDLMRNALLCDYIMLGGGNVRHLKELPPNCRRGSNAHAVDGGVRLWAADEIPRALPVETPPDFSTLADH